MQDHRPGQRDTPTLVSTDPVGPALIFFMSNQSKSGKDRHLWSITCLWLQIQAKQLSKYLWWQTYHWLY